MGGHDAGHDGAVVDLGDGGRESGSGGGDTRHDASAQCAPSGTGAIGRIGCPCASAGELSCTRNDSVESVICETGVSASTAGDTVVTLATDQSEPAYIVIDDLRAYWTNSGSGTVMAAPLDGGLPDGGSRVTLAAGRNGPFALAVNASRLFWTDLHGGTVTSISLDGGTPVTLASGQTSPGGIAIDGDSVYWTNAATGVGTVMKVTLWPGD